MEKSIISSESVAVIGLGALLPKAANYFEFWSNLISGRDCIESIPESRWRQDDYRDEDPAALDAFQFQRCLGGIVPDIWFDPVEFGLPPNTLEVIDATQLIALKVASRTLEDAGYPSDSSRCDHSRTGVVVGVAGTTMSLAHSLFKRLDYPLIEEILEAAGIPAERAREISLSYRSAYPNWNENAFPGLLANVVAGRISNRLNLGGQNFAVDAACASSLCAISQASTLLQSGQCDMVITGGVDMDNSISAFMSFAKTGILSPSGRVRSFDKHADGTLISEGIGLFALKRLGDALRDGDRIYAQIRGFGASSDGRCKSIYSPHQPGQVRALREAYRTSGIPPESVGLIEAHSPGTRVGDIVEVGALRDVFDLGDRNQNPIALGSVKSQIGHTKAAAGAAGMMKAVLALHHQVIPPTLNVETPNPELDLESSPFYLNVEARPWVSEAGHPRRAGINALGFGGTNYHAILEESPEESPTPTRFHINFDPDRAAPHTTASPGVMFAGQGTQFGGMGRDLALGSPVFRTAIDFLDGLFREDGKAELSGVLFPPPAFDPESRRRNEARLRDTHYAQAALAALQMAQFHYLQAAGVTPGCVFGHSFGELSALWAAEVLDDESFLRLVYSRGKSMSPDSGIETGTLLSVCLGLETLQRHLDSFPGLEIANLNAPDEIVVGGSHEEIAALARHLGEDSIVCIPLKVSSAFHTRFMDFAKAGWEDAVRSTTFSAPRIPVYSNTTAALHDRDPDEIRALLEKHPFQPVRFVEQVKKIHHAGHDSFLEIGPRNVLGNLVRRILPEGSFHAISSYPAANDGCLSQMDRALDELGLETPERTTPAAEDEEKRSEVTIRLSAAGYVGPETRKGFLESVEELKTSRPPAAAAPSPADGDSGQTRIQLATLEAHREFLYLQRAGLEALHQGNGHSDQIRRSIDEITRVHRDYIEGQIQAIRKPETRAGASGPVEVIPAPVIEFPALPVPVIEELPPPAEPETDPGQATAVDSAATLIGIISEKTGYPPEVILPDMDLEADLGIDSIKRVEIFAAIQESFAIELDPSEFTEERSVGAIADGLSRFVARGTAESEGSHRDDLPEPSNPKSPDSQEIPISIPVRAELPPAPNIRPAILGNTLILSDGGPRAAAMAELLESEGCRTWTLLFPGCDPAGRKNAGVIDGLTPEALDRALRDLDGENVPTVLQIWENPETFEAAEHVPWLVSFCGRIKPILEATAPRHRPTFLMLAAESAGRAPLPAHSCIGALARTLNFEWEEIQVRSVVFGDGTDAAGLLRECCAPNGPGECLLSGGGRSTGDWKEIEIGAASSRISREDILLVSGGARGITAVCIVALSQEIGGGKFILVGRTNLEDLPGWLPDNAAPEEIKKQIASRMASNGNRPSPREIESEFQRLSGLREINRTLAAISEAGGEAVYCCADIADPDGLREVVAPVLKEWGPFTGIIHGAGALADNLVEKLTRDDFLKVYRPKVTGLENMIALASPDDLKLCVFFSSVAAAFGNAGQSLYAISNQMLNDRVETLREEFPHARICSLNWGPWDAGMVTPLLKKRFQELGIRAIPVREGARIFNALIQSEPIEPANFAISDRIQPPHKPLRYGLARQIEPDELAVAQEHVIAGNLVLPAAWAVSWMVESAARLFPEPGSLEVDQLRVLHGIFPEEHPGPYSIVLEEIEVREDQYRCKASIQSGEESGNPRIHYSSGLRFSQTASGLGQVLPPGSASIAPEIDWRAYRRGYIHYGKAFHGVCELLELSDSRVVTLVDPPASDTLFNPLAYDLATHGILIWLDHFHGTACLPSEAGPYVQMAPLPSGSPLVVALDIKKFQPPAVEFGFVIHTREGTALARADGLKMTLTSQPETVTA